MFMPWTDAFLTGIQKVDEQHRWLVDMANRLHAALNNTECERAAIGDIIKELVGYTFKHFIMEEEMFERYGFPETASHKQQHDVFTDEVTELLQRYESGETVSNEALELLRQWLTNHILKTDKAYVPFFKSKGVT